MIINIKQRKIKIEPKTKLNYNIYKYKQSKSKSDKGDTDKPVRWTTNRIQLMASNSCYTISHDKVLLKAISVVKELKE